MPPASTIKIPCPTCEPVSETSAVLGEISGQPLARNLQPEFRIIKHWLQPLLLGQMSHSQCLPHGRRRRAETVRRSSTRSEHHRNSILLNSPLPETLSQSRSWHAL